MNIPKIKWTLPIILIIVGILIVAGTVIVWAATTYLTIPSTGTVKTSASISANVTTIDWGALNPGETVNRYVTLTNDGDNPTLPLVISNSSLTIGTLFDNAHGQTIQSHASITVLFRLIANADATPGPFSFDITISG